jgi:hypothetical protein
MRPRLWIDWGLKRENGFAESLVEDLTRDRCLEMSQLLTTHFGYSINNDLFTYEGIFLMRLPITNAIDELFRFLDPVGGYSEENWGRRFPLAFKTLFPAGGVFLSSERAHEINNSYRPPSQQSQHNLAEKLPATVQTSNTREQEPTTLNVSETSQKNYETKKTEEKTTNLPVLTTEHKRKKRKTKKTKRKNIKRQQTPPPPQQQQQTTNESA